MHLLQVGGQQDEILAYVETSIKKQMCEMFSSCFPLSAFLLKWENLLFTDVTFDIHFACGYELLLQNEYHTKIVCSNKIPNGSNYPPVPESILICFW